MSNNNTLYSNKILKLLSVFILIVSFAIFLKTDFRETTEQTVGFEIISRLKKYPLEYLIYFNSIINIGFIIKYKFKIRGLIGAILQLIAAIGLFIHYTNYKDTTLLGVFMYLILFISILMIVSIEEIKKGENENMETIKRKKVKSLENTEIKDDVEKWFQDVYMCWIARTSDEEDWNKIAGRDKNKYTIKEYKKILAEDWGIHNKEELLEMVDRLTIESIKEVRQDITIEDIKKHNINIESYLAWDMCRAVMIIGIAYIADYLTRDEMRLHSIKACKLIQKEFNSWDHLIRNYIIGCKEYFEELGHDEDRTDVYEMLKEDRFAYQQYWKLNLDVF